ncbi:Predicted arabinose efflux permease, MFS family [Prauserella marina]|uniref:Predicted arabinose efflux permease, MFS family n=1 Tax=Prauserella marina TaxID=530584 RepID=A0A1G6N7Z0_9PSEU|nr:MFS transporter [Prauserella marina]PWV82236.1 putative MFS family arabinose efflux permease [Prauserella marina]SDC63949.1 Predicted arabinose efflux permease, MFS family [Prauserella marina]
MGVRRADRPRLGADFGKLWAANGFTNVADGVALAAAPLLVASLTDNPILVGGSVFVQQLPWLLFSLISGAYVDRLDRRALLVAVNVIRGAVVGGLAVAIATDVVSVWLVYLAFFLLGTAETVVDNASHAVLPSIVESAALPNANARLIAMQYVANQFAAPPLGAALFAGSAALPFGLNAVCFVLAAPLLGALRRIPPVSVERRPLREEIAEGIRWLWRHQVLRMLALSICLMNLTLLAAFAILVLYAKQRLGLGAVGYGLLLTASAVGGLLGTAVASRLTARFSDSTLLRTGLVVETLTHVLLAVATAPWLASITLVVFGLHGSMWGVVSTTWRQRVIPENLRGRVTSVYLLFSVGGAALGSLLSGPIATAFGITAPFWCSAVIMAAMTVGAWRTFGKRLVG